MRLRGGEREVCGPDSVRPKAEHAWGMVRHLAGDSSLEGCPTFEVVLSQLAWWRPVMRSVRLGGTNTFTSDTVSTTMSFNHMLVPKTGSSDVTRSSTSASALEPTPQPHEMDGRPIMTHVVLVTPQIVWSGNLII